MAQLVKGVDIHPYDLSLSHPQLRFKYIFLFKQIDT